MTRIFIGFIVCFLFLNCNKKEEIIHLNNKFYIVSYEDKKFKKYADSLKENSDKVTFPSIKGFYCQNQLLIDSKGNLFFYQKEYIPRICGSADRIDTIPYLLNLQPIDLIQTPQSNVNDFLSLNILSKKKNEQRLIIASQNDTIKNKSIFSFTSKLKAYKIRRTTQEEDTVLKYKKNNESYNYEDIKWNQNRITLPFIKPKLKNQNE
ncbi:hypothetical protein [Flavobacterium branchiicola]|uniref:Lipoprotein n=1 Tax=Flavobacterium branchiicola TaxID=1114875 RepID=A0ABV9P909_9FLAO|nr:hypothetical protein [Flavobacterium branchiicola]MBS7252878.1 hypothetical protein [Flavobacterium branchiicola]